VDADYLIQKNDYKKNTNFTFIIFYTWTPCPRTCSRISHNSGTNFHLNNVRQPCMRNNKSSTSCIIQEETVPTHAPVMQSPSCLRQETNRWEKFRSVRIGQFITTVFGIVAEL
jgi:hypothetical protein